MGLLSMVYSPLSNMLLFYVQVFQIAYVTPFLKGMYLNIVEYVWSLLILSCVSGA